MAQKVETQKTSNKERQHRNVNRQAGVLKKNPKEAEKQMKNAKGIPRTAGCSKVQKTTTPATTTV